jgi:GNAT superfamily N-acetyltransferase
MRDSASGRSWTGDLSARSVERALRILGGEIREGRPDPEGLSALAEIIFPGEDVSDPRFIRWMYEQNPAGRALEYVTLNKGLVSGHIAAVPLRYQIGSRTTRGCVAINAITHPDYRGKGIFIILCDLMDKRCAEAGIEFTFGYANLNSEKGCLRHLAYRELGRFPLWLLPFRAPRILAAQETKRGVFWRLAARLAQPGARAWSAALRPHLDQGISVERLTEFGPEFDALWESVRGGYGNVLVRDRAFLDWRFVRPPTRRYEILAARKDGRLLGYLASAVMTVQGLRWAMIADMLVADTKEGRAAAARLVKEHVRRSRDAGADLAAGLMFKHAPAAAGLRRNGFLVCPPGLLPREFPILIRSNIPALEGEGFFNVASWYLTMGDYDAI